MVVGGSSLPPPSPGEPSDSGSAKGPLRDIRAGAVFIREKVGPHRGGSQ